MDFFQIILQYKFLTCSFAAGILSGIVCGIIGTYVVCRRMVFLSGGITHASFGGIGVAGYMGLNPVAGAAVFAVLSALGIEYASVRGKVREDSAIGIVWALGMAIGIIFIYMTPGYAVNPMNFLFGNILTVAETDVYLLGGLTVVILPAASLMMRNVMYVAFDREYAATQGIPVKFISYMMSVLTALAVVFSIRSVGIVLLISLLTMPAVIANIFTRSYFKMTLWAVIIAVGGNVAGLWISYKMDIPVGASTIILFTFMLAVLQAVKKYILAPPDKKHK